MLDDVQLNSLAIEVTNRCNMKCVMCVSHGAKLYEGQSNGHPAFIDTALFASIVKQYAEFPIPVNSQKTVLPQFQGEPLLHPRFLELCEVVEKNGLEFSFTTNASLLTPEMSRELLKFRHFNHIAFSVDGLSETTYKRIRIGADYKRVISHIEKFLELRREKGRGFITQVSITEQPMNEKEIDEFIFFWTKKVNFVSVNNVAYKGRPVKMFWKPKRIPCGDLWHFMIVLTNGKVVPCCRDYLYSFQLGNVMEKSLNEIWTGERYEEIRNIHREEKWQNIPLCNDCDTWMCRTDRREVNTAKGDIEITRGPFFRSARLKPATTANFHAKIYKGILARLHEIMGK